MFKPSSTDSNTMFKGSREYSREDRFLNENVREALSIFLNIYRNSGKQKQIETIYLVNGWHQYSLSPECLSEEILQGRKIPISWKEKKNVEKKLITTRIKKNYMRFNAIQVRRQIESEC